ncbi:hypothetical protein BKA70DRAFT_1473934 [Coprinopsis sp. MPI-PUGE-AT-0042]|nr:hypothetical protein BKA70DRAFT_1473934 [Coprinopsis sp. MPI-PUGE-AT-0042]
MIPYPCLVVPLVLWIAPLTHAVPRNITFDDNAPEISYNGIWARVPDGIGGDHHETIHEDAYATIQLPRKAIELIYKAPRWSFPVETDIYLKTQFGEVRETIDLQDHSAAAGPDRVTRSTEVVLQKPLSPDDEIELVVRVGMRLLYAIVDEIIVTVDEDLESSTTSSPSQPADTPPSQPPDTPPSQSTDTPPSQLPGSSDEEGKSFPVAVVAAMGAVGGILALHLLFGLVWCMRKRRRRRRAEQRQMIDLADPPLSPPPILPIAPSFSQQYATSEYNPYHPVVRHSPSQTAFYGSNYRSTSFDSGQRTSLGQKGRDFGYIGSSPNGEITESEARSTMFSTATGSSAPGMSPVPSGAGWYPLQGPSNPLRLVNESALPPPDYSTVVGGPAQSVATTAPVKGPSSSSPVE